MPEFYSQELYWSRDDLEQDDIVLTDDQWEAFVRTMSQCAEQWFVSNAIEGTGY